MADAAEVLHTYASAVLKVQHGPLPQGILITLRLEDLAHDGTHRGWDVRVRPEDAMRTIMEKLRRGISALRNAVSLVTVSKAALTAPTPGSRRSQSSPSGDAGQSSPSAGRTVRSTAQLVHGQRYLVRTAETATATDTVRRRTLTMSPTTAAALDDEAPAAVVGGTHGEADGGGAGGLVGMSAAATGAGDGAGDGDDSSSEDDFEDGADGLEPEPEPEPDVLDRWELEKRRERTQQAEEMERLQSMELEMRGEELQLRKAAALRIQSHYRGHSFRLKFSAQNKKQKRKYVEHKANTVIRALGHALQKRKMTLKALFDTIDRDNDNQLSAAELVHAARIVGVKLDEESAREVICLMDPDDDGAVSHEEFFKLFHKVNRSSRRRASVTDADLNKAMQSNKLSAAAAQREKDKHARARARAKSSLAAAQQQQREESRAATLIQTRFRGNTARARATGKKKKRKLRRRKKGDGAKAPSKPAVQSRKGLARLAAPSARAVEDTQRKLTERAQSRKGEKNAGEQRPGADQDGYSGAALNESDFRSSRPNAGNPYLPSARVRSARPTVLPPSAGAPATVEVYRRTFAQIRVAGGGGEPGMGSHPRAEVGGGGDSNDDAVAAAIAGAVGSSSSGAAVAAEAAVVEAQRQGAAVKELSRLAADVEKHRDGYAAAVIQNLPTAEIEVQRRRMLHAQLKHNERQQQLLRATSSSSQTHGTPASGNKKRRLRPATTAANSYQRPGSAPDCSGFSAAAGRRPGYSQSARLAGASGAATTNWDGGVSSTPRGVTSAPGSRRDSRSARHSATVRVPTTTMPAMLAEAAAEERRAALATEALATERLVQVAENQRRRVLYGT